MAKSILIEEFHLSFFAPPRLPLEKRDTSYHTLNRKSFQGKLRQAVRHVIKRLPSLRGIRFSISH